MISSVQNPEVICSSPKYAELKWIAGLFYWMESVQSYNVRGWNYLKRLHAFVDGGYSDPSFIDSVSGIVNRGCHDPVSSICLYLVAFIFYDVILTSSFRTFWCSQPCGTGGAFHFHFALFHFFNITCS